MILLIDAGNTRIKLDWMGAQGNRAAGGPAFTLAELGLARRWLESLPNRPTRALGVNVAGTQVAAALEAIIDCPIEWQRAGRSALGVRNGYIEPAQLGPDRWAAMLGLSWHERARRQGENAPSTAALLAIFGTATTIDTLHPAEPPVVEEAGLDETAFDFPGGLILPGPAMMLSALWAGTANLPQAQGDTALYPVHTEQAITTGVAAAQAGAVLRQWLAACEATGRPPELYVAGGGWPLVQVETERLLNQACDALGWPAKRLHVLDAPVLDGLACLARTARD